MAQPALDSPVTIAPQEDDQPVYLPSNVNPPVIPPTPTVANERAQKAEIGLGGDKNDIQAQIQAGNEQRFREAATADVNARRSMQQEQQLIDARNAKGAPLDKNDLVKIMGPYHSVDGRFGEADPKDVIERAYADKSLSMFNTAASYMRDTYFDQAQSDIPEHTAQSQKNFSAFTAQMEFARTLKQNVDNEITNQGWVPWLADQGKMLFQPYNEYKMRNVTGYQFEGLGTAMQRKADELFTSSPENFTKNLQAITEDLRKDNPSLASQFLDYVIGASQSERNLQNFFTVVSPFDLATVGKTGVGLVRAVELNNRVNNGFKQIIREAAKADGKEVPVRAVVQESMGDVNGAATSRAADFVSRSMNGKLDPVQDIKESLPSNFRLDGDLIDSAPGNLSRAQYTEIKDSFYRAGSNLYDTLVNILRVNRTPAPLSDEAARSAWEASQRAQYGKDLLDISSPIKMPETNTWHVAYTFGNADGRLFSDPETAINYAKNKGWADPRVLDPATGEVEKVPAQKIGTKTDIKTQARLQKSIPETEKYINDLKNKLSPKTKFVGPIHPDMRAEMQASLESAQGILQNMKVQLEAVGKKITTSEPVIEQHGLGYKYSIIRPYKETDDVVRDYLTSVKDSQSSVAGTGWGRWFNSFAGKFRSADDTLAYNESLNRKIATYTNKLIAEWAANEAKDIEAISNQTKWYTPWTWHRTFTRKDMFKEFNSTLDFARKAEDPATGEPGYFFKTPQELDEHYQRYFKRNVTFPEVKAYFAHVKLVEGNRVLSEIAEFRNRARLGAEQHQLFLQTAAGTKNASGFFDGVERKELPRGGGMIMFMGPRKGDERLFHLGANEVPGREWKKWEEAVSTGKARVLEIYDPDSHPLTGFVNSGNERIRYVVTTDSETKPLGFNHVNRRGGGHFDYTAPQYIKQANVVDEGIGDALTDKRRVFKRIYTGDNTFLAGSGVDTVDKNIASMMTEMNGHMKFQRYPEARDLAKKLGIEYSKIEEWYNPNHMINGKKVGARINWNEPFYVVPRNKRIYDIDKSLETRINNAIPDSFQDASKTGSLARQFQVEYSQARDAEGLHTINDVGSSGNPIYKMEFAKLTDPIPTMAKSLNRAIRGTFMEDYKISAVEHWLQEASPYLKAEIGEIRSAPFYHFHNADEGAFKAGTSKEIINNLLSNRFKIQQFIGMPNKTETVIQGATQKLVDSFYEKFGPEENRNILQKATTIVPLWMLSRWRDPISGVRSLAFNANLGFFALPQFLVQAQTFANVWALGGRAGANGTFGALLHQWSRINKSPEFMAKYDDLYQKLNFFGMKPKPGEFIEANRELGNVGFEHVGSDFILNDTAMQHKFFKNNWNNFLDAGQVFFKEGEKATRLGAWYTAFREFREANPVRAITDADRAAILNKADLYTANMSRASASWLNAGWASLPMQFLTYQVRMAELFWGNRITKMDKARLLGVYAALYGAPGAIGVTGYPFIDSLRESAMNHGYVSGDNQAYDLVMNGLVSWQMAMISGKGDYHKGNIYDVQSRWGTQGLSQISESLRSDKTIWSFMGGAGIDTLMGTVSKLEPFWQFAKQLNSEDEEGNFFRITPAHLNNLFSTIKESDNVSRSIAALHTGRWMDRNANYVSDATPWDVLWRNITGLKTVEETDIQRFRDIHLSEKQFQDQQEVHIMDEYRRGLQAVEDKDYETAQEYFTNARARTIFSGMPLDKRSEVFSRATKGYEPQTTRSSWDWATKNVPYGEELSRLNAETTRNQVRDYRNQ